MLLVRFKFAERPVIPVGNEHRIIAKALVTAWRLHRAWPGSELVVDEGEGHGGKTMVDAWADANSRLADRLA